MGVEKRLITKENNSPSSIKVMVRPETYKREGEQSVSVRGSQNALTTVAFFFNSLYATK